MHRRKFLALTGAAVTGLWLSDTGLIALPRRMIVALAGRCSFCDKEAAEVFGLAGVVGRHTRVCNECIEICLEIMHDDLLAERHALEHNRAPHVEHSTSVPAASDSFAITEMMRRPESARSGAELAALMGQIRQHLEQSEGERPQDKRGELRCSFCERKQHEAKKLVAGPTAYICDVCVGDAAAVLSLHA